MPISECSYCGSLTITENDVCTSCSLIISPPAVRTSAPRATPPTASFAPQSQPSGFETPAPKAANPFPPRQEFGHVEMVNCLRCGGLIPRGQGTCESCLTSKSSPHLKRIVFIVSIILVAFVGYKYGYEYISPAAVISKYESATNSDAEMQGFTLKGNVTVSQQNGFGDPAALETDLAVKRTGDKFDFKMAYQSPDKSAVEMVQGGNIKFKEVFDGVSGWSIDGMNGKNGSVQEKKNGFGLKRMGVGIDDFDSLEFIDGSAEREFALGRSVLLKARTALTVDGNKITLGDKVSVVGMESGSSTYDPTLLVFDRSSGLLIGMVKAGKLGTRDVTTTVFFDDYRKFPFKNSGFFSFLKKGQVMLPTQWTFVIGLETDPRIANPFSMVMTFAVTDVDLMGSVDPAIFKKP